MPLDPSSLREMVLELVTRPGHEKVRTLLYDLLVHDWGAQFRRGLREAAEGGAGQSRRPARRTVFEVKSDLGRELADAKEQLGRYLASREADTGDRYVGVATDGCTFVTYELTADELVEIGAFTPSPDQPAATLDWLDSIVAIRPELAATPDVVRRELGRGSPAYHLARGELAAMWSHVSQEPHSAVKRGLWRGSGAGLRRFS